VLFERRSRQRTDRTRNLELFRLDAGCSRHVLVRREDIVRHRLGPGQVIERRAEDQGPIGKTRGGQLPERHELLDLGDALVKASVHLGLTRPEKGDLRVAREHGELHELASVVHALHLGQRVHELGLLNRRIYRVGEEEIDHLRGNAHGGEVFVVSGAQVRGGRLEGDPREPVAGLGGRYRNAGPA